MYKRDESVTTFDKVATDRYKSQQYIQNKASGSKQLN